MVEENKLPSLDSGKRPSTPPEIKGLPETIDVKEGEPLHLPFEVHDHDDEPLHVYLQEAPPYCAVLILDGQYVLEVSPGKAPPPPVSDEQIAAIRQDEVRETIQMRRNLSLLLEEDLSDEEYQIVHEQLDALHSPIRREIYEEVPGDAQHDGRVVVRADDQRDTTDFELHINVTE